LKSELQCWSEMTRDSMKDLMREYESLMGKKKVMKKEYEKRKE